MHYWSWVHQNYSLAQKPSYSPIAFDKRVIFLAHGVPSHCRVRLLHYMRAWLRNGYMQAYMQIMQQTHTPKAVTGCVEPKKLLSHRRQLDYSRVCLSHSPFSPKINGTFYRSLWLSDCASSPPPPFDPGIFKPLATPPFWNATHPLSVQKWHLYVTKSNIWRFW